MNGSPPIHLGDVLDEIDRLVQHYISLPDPSLSIVVSAWIANTYTYMHFDYCGYLALRSVTPRCGKSRLLRLIGLLAKDNPPITTNPTPAVLFRCTRPVLLLDEVDSLRNQDKERYGEVLAVLNSGFERGRQVERAERTGSGFQLKAYDVYGPKALAGIEALADTLADRAFQIQMKRAVHRLPRLNPRKLSLVLSEIRQKLEQWSTDNAPEILAAYDRLPDAVPALEHFDDRFQDTSEPLVVLAALADTERPHGPAILPRLERGLNVAAGKREPSSRERTFVTFLGLIASRLDSADSIFITSTELLDMCKESEDLSFIETTKALRGFLKPFELQPKSNGTQRGYHISRAWYEEWWQRYGGSSSHDSRKVNAESLIHGA